MGVWIRRYDAGNVSGRKSSWLALFKKLLRVRQKLRHVPDEGLIAAVRFKLLLGRSQVGGVLHDQEGARIDSVPTGQPALSPFHSRPQHDVCSSASMDALSLLALGGGRRWRGGSRQSLLPLERPFGGPLNLRGTIPYGEYDGQPKWAPG